MKEIVTALTSKSVVNLIDQIGAPIKDVPHLPKGLLEFFATVSPWLAALGGVLGVISGLSMMSNGMGWQNSPLAALVGVSPAYFFVTGIIQLLTSAILLLAFSPLKNREKAGWVLLFWNIVLSLFQNLAGIAFGMPVSSLVGVVIGLAIGLYLYFEMRPMYK